MYKWSIAHNGFSLQGTLTNSSFFIVLTLAQAVCYTCGQQPRQNESAEQDRISKHYLNPLLAHSVLQSDMFRLQSFSVAIRTQELS